MDNQEILEIVSPMVHECTIIDSKVIPFCLEVRKACKRNHCGFYGASFSCPPAVGDLPLLKEKCMTYPHALLFSTFGTLKDSFDFEGMMQQRDKHDSIQQSILKALQIKNYLLLGAGACRLCQKCNYPNPCRHPKQMVPSIESHGIDVVSLAKNTKLHYMNGQNTVTYFSILFYK